MRGNYFARFINPQLSAYYIRLQKEYDDIQ